MASTAEAIQYTNSPELVDATQDRDLRSPIAPPVTLKEATVISFAGTTSKGKELVMSAVRQTLLSETQACEASETLMSETQVSAHTDTNTALLLQLDAMKKQLEATQAENVKLKAQVVEQSSSSTSVQRQLADIKDELDALKLNIIPKINSVQDSQMKTSEDIHSLTDSQLNV